MSEPRITRQAQRDLEEIWDNLAQRNEEAADRLLEAIMEKVRFHARFPLTGRLRDDLAPHLRSSAVDRHVVFFRPVDDTVEVLRVLHGSRDVDTLMKDQPAE